MNIKIQITEFQLPPFFSFFFFLRELYIFIARYTMKLLLEFANKVRSLFHPLYRWVWQKKKKERNYCNDGNDNSIQIFISSPRFNGESNVSWAPNFLKSGTEISFCRFLSADSVFGGNSASRCQSFVHTADTEQACYTPSIRTLGDTSRGGVEVLGVAVSSLESKHFQWYTTS